MRGILLRSIGALSALFMLISGANAASISFDMDTYIANPGEQVAINVNFDFTDLPAFGGGFNVIYDANVLQFSSYTQASFSGIGAPQPGASPLGMLSSPGNYLGAGVGSFDFFTGINTAGTVGTFTFLVLGADGDAGCGATLCLTPVATNQMVSLGGLDITDDVFANGISAAQVVPVPAAAWLFGSALGLLGWMRRKTM